MVEILIRPIVTEKMNAQAEKLNRYGFMVDKKANKYQIKTAVEEIYGVKVVSVNTMVYAGKLKSRFTKSGVITGRTNAYKKAVVTLNKGENIDFYSNI
jgi:large subunit ribosomal protein L23